MEQVPKQQPVNKTAFRVLVALSVTHCLNDSLQSVISAAVDGAWFEEVKKYEQNVLSKRI